MFFGVCRFNVGNPEDENYNNSATFFYNSYEKEGVEGDHLSYKLMSLTSSRLEGPLFGALQFDVPGICASLCGRTRKGCQIARLPKLPRTLPKSMPRGHRTQRRQEFVGIRQHARGTEESIYCNVWVSR